MAVTDLEDASSSAEALRLILNASSSSSNAVNASSNATSAASNVTAAAPSRPPGIDEALKEAIRRKRADCIRILAEFGADHQQAFDGMNSLHCLYAYTSGFGLSIGNVSAGVDETSTALIQSLSVSVNCDDPLGSHPLYSLIATVRFALETVDVDKLAVFANVHAPVFLSTLQILLDAGADPNLNEERLLRSRERHGGEARVTFGRQLHPSALAALFETRWQIDGIGSVQIYPFIHAMTAALLEAGARVTDQKVLDVNENVIREVEGDGVEQEGARDSKEAEERGREAEMKDLSCGVENLVLTSENGSNQTTECHRMNEAFHAANDGMVLDSQRHNEGEDVYEEDYDDDDDWPEKENDDDDDDEDDEASSTGFHLFLSFIGDVIVKWFPDVDYSICHTLLLFLRHGVNPDNPSYATAIERFVRRMTAELANSISRGRYAADSELPPFDDLVDEIRRDSRLAGAECVAGVGILLNHMSWSTATRVLTYVRHDALLRVNYFVGDDEAARLDISDDGLADPRLLPACVEIMEGASTSAPRSLQHAARLSVWKAIGREEQKLSQLPIPAKLVTCMFEPEFYGF